MRRSANRCANEFSCTKITKKKNQTTLVFQMVHGTNGLHVVVRGTNSQWYE